MTFGALVDPMKLYRLIFALCARLDARLAQVRTDEWVVPRDPVSGRKVVG